MPNWVSIRMMLTGPDASLEKFRKDNAYEGVDEEGNKFKKALSFNHLIPFPKELQGTTSPVPDTVPKEERRRLVKLYGADNWYDWKCHNWGTKWDACESSVSDNNNPLEYSFDTAWSLPGPWLEKLPEAYPDIKFVLLASEESGEFHLRMTHEPGDEEWGTEEFTQHEWYMMTDEDYASVAREIEKMPYRKFITKYAKDKEWHTDDYPLCLLEGKILARFKDKDLPTLVGHEWYDNQDEFERRLKGGSEREEIQLAGNL